MFLFVLILLVIGLFVPLLVKYIIDRVKRVFQFFLVGARSRVFTGWAKNVFYRGNLVSLCCFVPLLI